MTPQCREALFIGLCSAIKNVGDFSNKLDFAFTFLALVASPVNLYLQVVSGELSREDLAKVISDDQDYEDIGYWCLPPTTGAGSKATVSFERVCAYRAFLPNLFD